MWDKQTPVTQDIKYIKDTNLRNWMYSFFIANVYGSGNNAEDIYIMYIDNNSYVYYIRYPQDIVRAKFYKVKTYSDNIIRSDNIGLIFGNCIDTFHNNLINQLVQFFISISTDLTKDFKFISKNIINLI